MVLGLRETGITVQRRGMAGRGAKFIASRENGILPGKAKLRYCRAKISNKSSDQSRTVLGTMDREEEQRNEDQKFRGT